MKKKLLSSCLVLTICTIALAPIYNQLDLNTINTVHPLTELQELNLEKVSSLKQQLGSTDYTVTYPQAEEKVAVVKSTATSATKKPVTSTSTKKVTTSKPIVSTSTKATSTTKKAVAISTTAPKASTSTTTKVAATTTTSKSIKATTSTTNTTTSTNRGTSTITTSKATAVISTAKSFIGVPYVWGGTSASGFDCSGFTQYVLSKNGISVPRTAAAQYTAGTSVSKSNLRIGDLVFFTTYKAGPSHLGFYLGNGNFIHASSSKGVTISSLSSTYYSSRYIGARRVIN